MIVRALATGWSLGAIAVDLWRGLSAGKLRMPEPSECGDPGPLAATCDKPAGHHDPHEGWVDYGGEERREEWHDDEPTEASTMGGTSEPSRLSMEAYARGDIGTEYPPEWDAPEPPAAPPPHETSIGWLRQYLEGLVVADPWASSALGHLADLELTLRPAPAAPTEPGIPHAESTTPGTEAALRRRCAGWPPTIEWAEGYRCGWLDRLAAAAPQGAEPSGEPPDYPGGDPEAVTDGEQRDYAIAIIHWLWGAVSLTENDDEHKRRLTLDDWREALEYACDKAENDADGPFPPRTAWEWASLMAELAPVDDCWPEPEPPLVEKGQWDPEAWENDPEAVLRAATSPPHGERPEPAYVPKVGDRVVVEDLDPDVHDAETDTAKRWVGKAGVVIAAGGAISPVVRMDASHSVYASKVRPTSDEPGEVE